MTELGELPVDGLRPVMHYLDAYDLTRLFCTFDRRVMKVMSFPGAIPRLHLELLEGHVPRALLRYFVSHVRNVADLSLVDWKSQDFELLPLNPLRLVIDDRKANESFRVLHARGTSLTTLGASAPRSVLLPDFPRQTPRLEALTLTRLCTYDLQQPVCDPILLPPTITSLRGHVNFELPSLPRDLRSLTLQRRHVSLKELFLQCPMLEKLEITESLQNDWEESIVFPESLTHLRISECKGIDNLVSCLPKSVLRLDWAAPRYAADMTPKSWPIGLRALNLSFTKDASHFTGLSSLRTLEYLSVKGQLTISADENFSSHQSTLSLASLPESLTSIVIDCIRFNPLSAASSITPRMAALTSLIAHYFHVEELGLFRKHAPRCTLYLEADPHSRPDPIYGHLTNSNGFQPSKTLETFVKLLRCFTPNYERHAVLTMRCKCIQRLPDGSVRPFVRTAFSNQLLWMDLTSMEDHDHKLHICSSVDAVELHALKPYKTVLIPPYSMTRLNLGNLGSLQMAWLPSTLTSLSSSAKVTVSASYPSKSTGWPFALTHLDTPHWSFPARDLGCLRGLQVFNANIVDLADYNVIDFLTIAMTPQTHRNMKIGIEYYVTGALVPDDAIAGLKDVTWSSLRDSTSEYLKRALAAPLPVTPAEGTPYDDSAHALHEGDVGILTIGSGVTSFRVSKIAANDPRSPMKIPSGAPVCIPSSATRVNLAEEPQSDIYPNWQHLQVQPTGMRPEIRAHTYKEISSLFGNDSGFLPPNLPLFTRGDILRCMTILDVPSRPLWFAQLPSSLRYLHISYRSPADQDFNTKFPPQLEVLILAAKSASGRPVISFSELPQTLRKLAILTMNWVSEGPLPDSFVLPRLNTVLLEATHDEALLRVWPTLSKSPLERFEFCSASCAEGNVLQSYGITYVLSIDLKELTDEDCETPQPGPSRPKIPFSGSNSPSSLAKPGNNHFEPDDVPNAVRARVKAVKRPRR